MTGKYAGTVDVVTITALMDTEIIDHLHTDGTYDALLDVEFTVCDDGLLIDIPLTGGTWSRHVLTVSDLLLDRPEQFMVDLKGIYDGKASAGDQMADKAKTIMEAA